MKQTIYKITIIYQFWRDYRQMYKHYYLTLDLKRLIKWAAKKHLSGPKSAYEKQLLHHEQKMLALSFRNNIAIWVIPLIHGSIEVFASKGKPYKGMAAKYRYENRIKSYQKCRRKISIWKYAGK